MKIVCDSCGAKYSIADEKVAGKVFKIRCKKCSGVIVVRGDQVDQAADAGAAQQSQPPQSSYDYGGDAVWHIVVNGDQQGPYAPAQLGEMITAGTIDWEAYVWREGFEGWLAARDVPELVEAITGQPQGQAEEAAPASQPPAAAGGGMGADPFAGAGYGGEAPQQGADPFAGGGFGGEAAVASRATHDAGADLFAQADASASPFGGAGGEEDDDDVVASAPSPRVSAAEASMTGQRNENSVLFSLANLQALATGSPGSSAPAPSPTPSSSGGGKAGFASGEGSGLIDIKALAAAGTGGGGAGAGGAGDRAHVDDLLSIGAGGGLGSSLGAPVLAPAAEPEKSNRGLMIGIIGGAAVIAVAAVAVALVLVLRSPEPQAVAANGPSNTPSTIAAGDNGAAAPGGGAAPAPSGDQGNTAAPAPAADPSQQAAGDDSQNANDDSHHDEHGGGGHHHHHPAGHHGGSSGGGSTSSGSSPTPAATGGSHGGSSGGDRSLDSLLDQALGGGGGGSNLPATPSRDAVGSALRSVAGAVSACGHGEHGIAMAQITVKGSNGRVSHVNVTGQFAGSPVGSCVARAIRGAHFPRFAHSTFSVTFPYRL